ncbi:NAD(P)-binding domain-containing protein [Smaragdicoccus niigatensis]|uniref:NAD(P)-binding domain-containing protein n=1 Tax=Smaragdicoccus niigatensis TaxID=359359 RepID=UPI00058D58DF|nr:NAD(P)-binding domain-containing protein [Smaragdicoccus niigatensis]
MRRPDYDVIIIGAGFGGLCAAIKLREAGIDNFVVLEKADEVGGTWRENTYPGAACDVMSLMYSFSFAPNPNWSRGYATQPEIFEYLKHVTDKYDLRRSIVFGAEVVAQQFDADSDIWTITAADGREFTSRVVIAGTGPLHVPKIPALPGIETFRGTSFHSAQWDHSIDFRGRRVAVIGTGASAVQFIPHLVDQAEHVTVFQRTPAWVLPKPDRPIPALERTAYRLVPGLRKLVRSGIYLSHEALTAAYLEPRYMTVVRALALAHLRRQVRDPELRAKLTPSYQVGCKRMVLDNRFYPALQHDNASLVTEPIAEVTPTGIRSADGREHRADVIVYGTGFNLGGRRPLVAEAYLGLAVHGFPNYFMLMGPNTGVGNQSVVFLIEAQTRYIMTLLESMRRGESTRVEVKAHVQAEFNRELQRRSQGTVWTSGGCKSWYLDAAGVNRAIWPAPTLSYWMTTRNPDLRDFEFTTLEERDDDDEFHGPALLVTTDGAEHPVVAHLLALYQPIDNAIRWSGRIEPCAALAEVHTATNTAVTLRIPGNPEVRAMLTDSDTWGGSHIVGSGTSPYPIYATL